MPASASPLTYLQYTHAIKGGAIVACEACQQAASRHLNDLERAGEWVYDEEHDTWTQLSGDLPYRFDENRAAHAIAFFGFLRHSKGEWAGRVFELEPWQQFLLAVLFGWVDANENRRFRVAYIQVARKNGKSTLGAGIGLYLFLADCEPGAEVYTAATKKDQASIIHDESTRMVKKSPYLRERVGIFRHNLHHVPSDSKYEPLGSDSSKTDGLNPSGIVIDELHAWKDRLFWDVLDTATGSRRQPLMPILTTPGYDKATVCYEQYDYAKKVLGGVLADESFFAMIFELDEGDDWEDEANWIKANPNLGVSVKLDDMRKKASKAKNSPASHNAFLRLKLGRWTDAFSRWLPAGHWKLCAGEVDEEELAGRRCYGGLDLSSVNDLTSLGLLFPPEEEGEPIKILVRFWMPEDRVAERVSKDRVPYDRWINEGLIEATPGAVVNHEYVMAQVDRDCQAFDVREIAYDRWGASWVFQQLQELGGEDFAVEFGQGFASMARPTRDFERLICAHGVAHGGNAVLTWQAGNVVVEQNAAGDMKPNKAKSAEKIDGIVACMMGLDRLHVHGVDDSEIECEWLT